MVRCGLALAVAGLSLAACSPRDDTPDQTDVTFEVDPALIGPVYENSEIGFRFQPPVDWEPLDDRQRQAVLDALADESAPDANTFQMEVRDVLFSTDTLSFVSLSVIGDPSDEKLRPAAYADAYGQTIGLDQTDAADAELIARMDFSVNGVSVTQFRHLQGDRVTFTLVLAGGNGKVVQLDYSIPTDAYQRESVKLESSIGTIQTPQTE